MIADWKTNVVFLATMLKIRHPDLFAQLHSTLICHGVEVRLLTDVLDVWARDYCPIQVSPRKLVKFRYDPDYLKEDAQLRTGEEVVASFRHLGKCRQSLIVLDGGNIVASKTKAILTDKIYKENPGWTRDDLRNEIQGLLQVDQLVVIPREPYDPIGHTDAMLRFIDDNTVLVNDYADVDPAFGDRLARILRRHGLAIELIPYYLEKRSSAGIPSAVGCYTNFLRVEKLVIAPIYGSKCDQIALTRLQTVFPQVNVLGLDCTDLAREGGVLNCITATYRTLNRRG